MNLPCDSCLVFSLCKNRYQDKNVVFCDLLHKYAYQPEFKDADWFILKNKFSNNKLEMIATESLERKGPGEIITWTVPRKKKV